jgi:hypothetical protein
VGGSENIPIFQAPFVDVKNAKDHEGSCKKTWKATGRLPGRGSYFNPAVTFRKPFCEPSKNIYN